MTIQSFSKHTYQSLDHAISEILPHLNLGYFKHCWLGQVITICRTARI